MKSFSLVPFLVLFVSACSSAPPTQTIETPPRPDGPERFFDWTRLQFAAEEHATRRRRLIEELGEGVFLAPAQDGFSSGGTFRQTDDFLYFTGLELPNSVVAIDATRKRTILFAPETDARFESASRPNDFPGRDLARDPAIGATSGIADVRPYAELAEAVADWVGEGRKLWIDAGRGGVAPVATDFVRAWTPEQILLSHLRARHSAASVHDARPAIARLRMVKSAHEIERIRQACNATMAGIRVSAGHVRAGIDERGLEAEMEAEFKRHGAQRLAFDSIIKSGPNSLWPWRILAAHYDRRNRVLQDGELVIYDVGCEVDHYASDVGRTFPVSGRFTDVQREKLLVSTGVADTIIAAIRPGITLLELQAVAEAAIPEAERAYMQTGLFFGHHIGLYVGDPSLAEAPLEPGMIFTVEPWYYNHDLGISVFVEDVLLVTEDGAENLTRALPRDPAALEAMVRR